MKNLRKKVMRWIAALSLFLTVPGVGDVRQVQSLDGVWEIAFDPGNVGKEASWHMPEKLSELDRLRTIMVPSCWEETEKDYEGVAYYRKRFTVPLEWEKKAVRLQFGAVNFRAEVWLNGIAIGVHEGGFTPFEFRIDDRLESNRENTLVLRVAGPILLQDKAIDGVGAMETPQWRGAIAGGIWQPVRLVATGGVYVEDVFIEPRISDNAVVVHTWLRHGGESAEPAKIDIWIRGSDQADAIKATVGETLKLKPGLNRQRWVLKISDAKYWSPDSPYLYEADVKVAAHGEVSDRRVERFGMRQFTIRNGQFELNGEPLFLKATFFEGLYPNKLAYPDSREMAVREIQLAKDAGFNMIRPWRKPPPPLWLDLADEMGVLVVGSLAVECMDLPIESASLPAWVENEVRESILRDRNRACIVQWELFNELKRPVLMRLLHPMSMLARELDPTRLILDESGGWAQGAKMYLPDQPEPIKFNDIHDYPGPQINDEVYNKLILTGSLTHQEMRARGLNGRLPGKNVVPGLMTFFSELGYGSLPDLESNIDRFARDGNPIVPPAIYHGRLADEHRRVLKESGFDEIYPDLTKFCLEQQQIHGTANRRMIEAVRCNPNVRGYCIHALTAGNWITGAGLLDLFRNPKTYAYEGTKAANQPRVLSIRVRPRNVYAERGTMIEVTGVNELDEIVGSLHWEIVDDEGVVVLDGSTKVGLNLGITSLFSNELETRGLEGAYTVRVALSAAGGRIVVAGEHEFDVFAAPQLVIPTNRIALLDAAGTLRGFVKRCGIDFVEFDPQTDPLLPVLISRTEAKNPEQRRRFRDLARFIEAGGTGIYLQGGGTTAPFGSGGKASPLLPVAARIKQAIGTWNGVPHLIKDHPIFDGLPVNGMTGAVYENVWARTTLPDLGGETIAASIGYDWFPDYDLAKRHYYGPGETWWGADLAIVPYGKGRCIVSQFQIVEHLGEDPVADKLLFNLIRFGGDVAGLRTDGNRR